MRVLRAVGGIFLLAALGCSSSSSRQVQAKAANAIAVAANQAASLLVDQYRKELGKCLAFDTRLEFAMCVGKVNNDWARVRADWADLADLQNQWATALEKGSSEVEVYAQAVLKAYCDIAPDLPPGIALPAVAGVVCGAP